MRRPLTEQSATELEPEPERLPLLPEPEPEPEPQPQPQPQPQHVRGVLFNYLRSAAQTDMAIDPVGSTVDTRDGRYEQKRCDVLDARPLRSELRLDREGFSLHERPSALAARAGGFSDPALLEHVYTEECRGWAQQLSGAADALVLGYTRRSDASGSGAAGASPAREVHNDFTAGFEETIAGIPGFPPGRHMILNLWRCLSGAHSATPLAFLDSSSWRAETEAVSVDLSIRGVAGTTQIMEAVHSEAHRWYYFSATQPDELVAFKTFDSATDGRCRFTLHSAFDYPEGTALHRSEVTPRESVEVRVLCIDCPTESAGASAKL